MTGDDYCRINHRTIMRAYQQEYNNDDNETDDNATIHTDAEYRAPTHQKTRQGTTTMQPTKAINVDCIMCVYSGWYTDNASNNNASNDNASNNNNTDRKDNNARYYVTNNNNERNNDDNNDANNYTAENNNKDDSGNNDNGRTDDDSITNASANNGNTKDNIDNKVETNNHNGYDNNNAYVDGFQDGLNAHPLNNLPLANVESIHFHSAHHDDNNGNNDNNETNENNQQEEYDNNNNTYDTDNNSYVSQNDSNYTSDFDEYVYNWNYCHDDWQTKNNDCVIFLKGTLFCKIIIFCQNILIFPFWFRRIISLIIFQKYLRNHRHIVIVLSTFIPLLTLRHIVQWQSLMTLQLQLSFFVIVQRISTWGGGYKSHNISIHLTH